MASISREIRIAARPEDVWAAIRDVAAVHRRLVPGVVVDAYLDGDARVVTFANGSVVRELILDIDDSSQRFAYAAVGGRSTYHHASMQVFADGADGSRVVWVTDVLPQTIVGAIRALVEQGADAMKRTLEAETTGTE